MIHSAKFLISQRPYAVDLSTFELEANPGHDRIHWHGRIEAVWFRRRGGRTVACIGGLRDSQEAKPEDPTQFLTRFTDGRHGGDCWTRWDGERLWSALQNPDVVQRHHATLTAMLAGYPAVPPGDDGWWRF